MTIIGSGTADFVNSMNWVVTVGDAMNELAVGNAEVGYFADIDDRFGKQFMVKMVA